MRSHSLSQFFLLLIFIIFGVQSGAAQTKLTDCTQIQQTNDFLALADRRAELIDDTQDLTGEIAELEKQLPDAITVADLEKLKKDIDDLEKKNPRSELENQTLLNLQHQLKTSKTDADISAELAKKRQTLADDKNLLYCVQSAVSQLTSPDKKFRLYISSGFALLVGSLIIGFFLLAALDETVRRAIFSGDTGIQFVTLFSLVIAIILFGITGILESRELSALLGGLSGYILGRTGRQAGAAPPAASGAGTAGSAQSLNSITVAPNAVTLSATSSTVQLAATPRDASGAQLADPNNIFIPVWRSSDPKVATVNDKGLVSMVGPGNCSITASFANVTSNPCQIAVR